MLPLFLTKLLRCEFDQYRDGHNNLNLRRLTSFMLRGYPNSSRARLELGARIILDQFAQMEELKWKDLLEMYVASYQTNPQSIRLEFVHRGYEFLSEIGPLLDHALGFGFEPYVLNVKKEDTPEDVLENCMGALQSISTGLLIFVVMGKRVSLLIPCLGESFMFVYFNPNAPNGLDKLLTTAFRNVRDLNVFSAKRCRVSVLEVHDFLNTLSATVRNEFGTSIYSLQSVLYAAGDFLGAETGSASARRQHMNQTTEVVAKRRTFKTPIRKQPVKPKKKKARRKKNKKKEKEKEKDKAFDDMTFHQILEKHAQENRWKSSTTTVQNQRRNREELTNSRADPALSNPSTQQKTVPIRHSSLIVSFTKANESTNVNRNNEPASSPPRRMEFAFAPRHKSAALNQANPEINFARSRKLSFSKEGSPGPLYIRDKTPSPPPKLRNRHSLSRSRSASVGSVEALETSTPGQYKHHRKFSLSDILTANDVEIYGQNDRQPLMRNDSSKSLRAAYDVNPEFKFAQNSARRDSDPSIISVSGTGVNDSEISVISASGPLMFDSDDASIITANTVSISEQSVISTTSGLSISRPLESERSVISVSGVKTRRSSASVISVSGLSGFQSREPSVISVNQDSEQSVISMSGLSQSVLSLLSVDKTTNDHVDAKSNGDVFLVSESAERVYNRGDSIGGSALSVGGSEISQSQSRPTRKSSSYMSLSLCSSIPETGLFNPDVSKTLDGNEDISVISVSASEIERHMDHSRSGRDSLSISDLPQLPFMSASTQTEAPLQKSFTIISTSGESSGSSANNVHISQQKLLSSESERRRHQVTSAIDPEPPPMFFPPEQSDGFSDGFAFSDDMDIELFE